MPGKSTRVFCLFHRIMVQGDNLTYNIKLINNFPISLVALRSCVLHGKIGYSYLPGG